MWEPLLSRCTVLHLILEKPFLNFPLWSCPALWHAQWRPQRRSHWCRGQDPMSLTAVVNAVSLVNPCNIHTFSSKCLSSNVESLFSVSVDFVRSLIHPVVKHTFVASKVRPYSIHTPQSSHWMIIEQTSPCALFCPGVHRCAKSVSVKQNTQVQAWNLFS